MIQIKQGTSLHTPYNEWQTFSEELINVDGKDAGDDKGDFVVDIVKILSSNGNVVDVAFMKCLLEIKF